KSEEREDTEETFAETEEEEIAEEPGFDEEEELLKKKEGEAPEEPFEEEQEEEGETGDEAVDEELEEKIFPPDEAREGEEREPILDFKTEDLERLVDPAEKEKEEIEQFLESLKKEREEKRKKTKTEEGLPPWASSLKEEDTKEAEVPEEYPPDEISPESAAPEEIHGEMEDEFPGETGEEEEEPETQEEEELIQPTPDERLSLETTMGFPETVDQKPLPFDALEEEKEPALAKITRAFKFAPWVKALLFDIFFIGIFWAVSILLAGRLLGVSFRAVVSRSSLAVAVYFLILLAVYFFLFFVFLGKTLGNQLFPREEL
ncbi:MAG: hypothetical protein ACOC57_06490, partial [Acidobacteriota bacterium]